MSFDLLLESDGLTDANVIRLVEFSAGAGTWPLYGWTTGSSRRGFLAGLHRTQPAIGLAEHDDDGLGLFVEGESMDREDVWVVASGSRGRFRATLNLLAEELPGGFNLRATHVGSVVKREVILTPGELADAAEGDGLRECTRYVVRSRFT